MEVYNNIPCFGLNQYYVIKPRNLAILASSPRPLHPFPISATPIPLSTNLPLGPPPRPTFLKVFLNHAGFFSAKSNIQNFYVFLFHIFLLIHAV